MKLSQSRCPAKGMTLLELTVVILVILSLISMLFLGARTWKKGSDRAGCIINIRRAQQAVRSYQNIHQLNDLTPLDMHAELIGPGKLMELEPRCPGGGTYTLATVIPPAGTLAIDCSLGVSSEHMAPGSGDW